MEHSSLRFHLPADAFDKISTADTSQGVPANATSSAIFEIFSHGGLEAPVIQNITEIPFSYINYWQDHRDQPDEVNQTSYILAQSQEADTTIPPHEWVRQELLREIERSRQTLYLIRPSMTDQAFADITIEKCNKYLAFLKELSVSLYERSFSNVKIPAIRVAAYQPSSTNADKNLQNPDGNNSFNPSKPTHMSDNYSHPVINNFIQFENAAGSRTVNTQGGDYLENGDKVMGDKIMGDKIITRQPVEKPEATNDSENSATTAQFPPILSSDQAVLLYQFLTKEKLVGNTSLLDALYILGCTSNIPDQIKPIQWLGTKQNLRQVLTGAYRPTPEGQPIRMADIERLAPLCFTDKNGQPLTLAKPKKEISSISDTIENFFKDF